MATSGIVVLGAEAIQILDNSEMKDKLKAKRREVLELDMEIARLTQLKKKYVMLKEELEELEKEYNEVISQQYEEAICDPNKAKTYVLDLNNI